MVSITIPNVPPEVRDELAAKAARKGQSLQTFLREHLVELARRSDHADAVGRWRDQALERGWRLAAEEIVDWVKSDRRSL